ncbi:MAG: hypothetical protein IPM54_07480 [Polyangiaceae bacterium]|nr:hypothetical protein [Polyangiaceae bacterium]
MSSSEFFGRSLLTRRLALRAGLVFSLLAPACAQSDKPAALEPDKPKAATVETKPEAKLADDKAAETKVAEEKAAAEKAAAEKVEAEKAAAEKVEADKALAKEPEKKVAEPDKGEAKAKGPGDAAAKADAPKAIAVAPKAVSPKATKIDAPRGILAKGAADKLVKAGDRPVVKLLEAGAAPRAVASYALVKGAAKPLQMGMDLEMAMDAGGMKLPPTRMPRMNLLFDFTTGDRSGVDWPIDGKLRKVSVEPKGAQQDQIAAALRPQLGALEGIGMNYFLDEKGRLRDVKVTLPPSLPPMAGQMMSGMTQSLESMTAPLPDEPIGVGATWEVLSRIVANGADLLQITTFTLEKRDKNLLSLDAVVRQYAAKDGVNPPGMPPGTAARLVSYKCNGSGKSVFDTADVAPRSGSTSINSSMTIELKIDADGKSEKQETSVDTNMTASFSRAAP